jgi:hypothetical protein
MAAKNVHDSRLPGYARTARHVAAMLGVALLACVVISFGPRPSFACPNCGCIAAEHGGTDATGTTRGTVAEQHDETRWHITEEFNDWELFMIQVMFREHFLPAMMMFANEMSAVAMQQMWMLGEMIDAKQQLETQRLLQRMKAEAHKDYQPSTGMCVFGTTVRSLAAAERRAETTTFILSQRAQDRELGQMNTVAAEGAQQDKHDRLLLLRSRYCKKNDNGFELDGLCTTNGPGETSNRDVDYSRLIDRPLTLNVDFTDGEPPTDDEIDLFALSNNLYAHNVFSRMPESLFQDDSVQNRQTLLNLRALTAKRSVAENSFNVIAGMRAMGSPAATGGGNAGSSVDTAQYLRVIIQQLGLNDDDEITKMIGERPSYYAQMDILTKKLYQRPEFYTDLYDTPANVGRKEVAMQAIGLMQDFDTLKSFMRQEVLLALIVEMELESEQSAVTDTLGELQHEGTLITDPNADP